MSDGFARFHAVYKPVGGGGVRAADFERLTFPLPAGFKDLLATDAGAIFNCGVYRLHAAGEIHALTALAEAAFPSLARRILCFASDWLGRQFALDASRRIGDEPLILLLEPGTGEVLELPTRFEDFHNAELVEDPESALAQSFFDEWRRQCSISLGPGECVGYRVPLFLGGRDDVTNLEPIDMTVYWSICGQLLRRTRTLPRGATIRSITFP